VAGKAAPEATEQFLQQTEFSLTAAQEWLAGKAAFRAGWQPSAEPEARMGHLRWRTLI